MRRIHAIPKTDLNRFLKEVLHRGPEAALPKNLPDRWLRALCRDISRARKANLDGNPEDPAINVMAPVFAVAAFLTGSSNADPTSLEFTSHQLTECIDRYGDAIAEEIVGRQTGVFIREYTLDNIV